MQKFSLQCTLCPRLVQARKQSRETYPDFHAAPVPSFGDPNARLLIVGLAPGFQGANRTGRPFTGDHAGLLLYETLFQWGWSNQPSALQRDDGLHLRDCRITNAVRCWPPANKPTSLEIRSCQPYLLQELKSEPPPKIVLALGKIAHDSILDALGYGKKDYFFGHGVHYSLPNGIVLISSYHCSRYNTQTKRLTAESFQGIFRIISQYLP
ncbi:MAG: uracil-DNA glycosylase [Ferrovum sp.]|nr:uracil-DNA glycosylase [Ferrovum sp.]